MVCVPTDRFVFENDVPVPIAPSMLLVHVSDAPVNAPSSGSLPEPAKDTDAALDERCVIRRRGDRSSR